MGSCVSTSIHKYAVTNVTDTTDTTDTTNTTGQVVATQPLVEPVATVVPALDAAALEAMNMLDITMQVQTTVQSWLAGLQPVGSTGLVGSVSSVGVVGVVGVVEDRAMVVDKLSAMFARNDSTYQYSTRSANRVLLDPNAHIDFFKQHNYHWYLCRNFDEQMRQHGSKLAQCSIKMAQCMVIALLAKQQSNQPKLLGQLNQLDNGLLSHCAVALTLQLLCNTRSPATQLMLDRLVISLWRRGNILDDDYHTSFCSAIIGSSCHISNQYVVKHIVQTLLT